MKKREQNVGLVVFPITTPSDTREDTQAGNIPFSNLVDILHALCDNLYIITGDKNRVLFKKDKVTHISEVRHQGGAGLLGRIILYVFTQLKLSLALVKLSNKVSLWIFFIGSEKLLLPMLTARLCRKQVALALSGFPAKVSEEETTRLFRVTDLLFRINLALVSKVFIYSARIINEFNMDRYRDKIIIAPRHFLDFDRFKIQSPLAGRDNLVAFFGRLSEGKGIPDFMEAVGKIVDSRGDIRFLIGGDGPLRGSIEEYIEKAGINSQVKFAGWIAHDELPGYLNQVKLLVLPSHTEALPNIILEAMACGTPVLATPVGAIPELIKDGITGFIMEEISRDGIARDILRALDSPHLEEIARRARDFVESEYTYEAAVSRYQKILSALDRK